jgi:site-specific DNA-methyltransferase (adenine-specific)
LINQVGAEIKRILKNDGSFFLNIGNRPKDQLLTWDVASALRKDFTLQNQFTG